MCGCIPKQQRFVKPYTVIVQPGDDEKKITSSFGVCPCRAHELVGANLDQPLADVGTGQVYKRFAGLVAGTKLRVPASWKDPGSYTVDGRVGEPINSMGVHSKQTGGLNNVSNSPQDAFTAFLTQVQAVVNGVQPGVPLPLPTGTPAGVKLEDLYAVVYSWVPYLQNTIAAGGVPALPTLPPAPTPPQVGLAFKSLVTLLGSAAAFLQATGIQQGLDPVIQNIPWDRFPWTATNLWSQIGKAASNAGLTQTEIWQQIDTLANSVMAQYTTPATPLKAIGGNAPNFATANWSSLVGTTPIGESDWNDNITEFLSDAKVQECLAANPDRLVAMSACTSAFETGGLEFFRSVLCSTDPTNPCEATPPLPPAKKDDDIIPDDKKDDTIDPVNVVDTAKKDNTALYVGAAAVGLLVGGLALWAAGGKD